MIISEIREPVFTAGKTEYYVLDNGYKNWYIPKCCVKKGLDIFQAMPAKTIVGKALFKKFHKVGLIRKMFKAKVETLEINDEIKSVIENYVSEDYCVAVYGGNWESAQNHKITLQIYNDEKIMLYIKMTNEDVVRHLFEREIRALNSLSEKNIVELPKSLGMVRKGEWSYFIQKPSDGGFKTERKFSMLHLEKLKAINEATAKECNVEETDLYRLVSEENARGIKQEDSKFINEAYEQVKNWIKNEKVSFAHGDFTPWNVYANESQLYCFDLEYGQDKATPFFDFFHFICMYSIVAKKNKVKYIKKMYKKYYDQINEVSDARNAFIAYLVYILNFYFSRFDETYDTKMTQYQVRIQMLKLLMEDER